MRVTVDAQTGTLVVKDKTSGNSRRREEAEDRNKGNAKVRQSARIFSISDDQRRLVFFNEPFRGLCLSVAADAEA